MNDRIGVGDGRLKLLFHSSGATQHVFTRMDRPGEAWVYKSPAIIDSLLPSPVRLSKVQPTNRGKGLAYAMFYRVPRGLWWRFSGRYHGNVGVVRTSVNTVAQAYGRVAQRLVSLYLRRARRQAFRRVLRIHKELSDLGLGPEVLLPFQELPDTMATLHVGGVQYEYRGAILAQRRADVFFELADGVEGFDWCALVDIQHRLWRNGVALADADSVLGPQGWALYGGRLLLGDTGSLTRDRELAMRTLCPGVLDRRQQSFLSRITDPVLKRWASENYARVRSQLNQRRLLELWCADLTHDGQRQTQ